MNYIARLQADLAAEQAQRRAIEKALRDFAVFLHSDKFVTQEGGERSDWISTGDVLNWLREVPSIGHTAHNEAFAESVAEYEKRQIAREEAA